MYYNILWYSQKQDRNEFYLKILEHSKPDVLVISELSNKKGDNNFFQNVIKNYNKDFSKGEFHPSNNGRQGCDVNIYFNSNYFSLLNQDFIRSKPRDHALFTLKEDNTGDSLIIIGSHLQASDGTEERLKRRESVIHLLNYLETHKLNENIIYGGDLNLYGSSEAAYQLLVEDSVLIDPLAAGKWHDNEDYKEIHTQSTRKTGFGGGGLDDRFDFILFSSDLLDSNEKVRYIQNSCTDIGNDGGDLNQAINNGNNSEISKDLADALFKASDHLPVILKISVN